MGRVSSGRVMSAEAARETVLRWRSQGHEIAFVRGVFDLLDVGHVRRIANTGARADRVVVLVESDSRAAALGAGLPVVGQSDRARLVAGLDGVDLVVPIGEAPLDWVGESPAEAIDPAIEVTALRRIRERIGSA